MMKSLNEKFNLKDDQATKEEIQERIAAGEKITGTNLFILIIAILIACIGLNLDSTAIVIGAMLISPLMGVIISLAYGIANHDTVWTKRALLAFLTQIGISMIASTIYFILSPIDFFSGELAARTKPNIFDVLIGVLGGSAAIIANTRKNLISNVIPGTAIATALMPPLCTIGYCIANQNWISALGAAYLFTINSVCICLSALVGLHLMKITNHQTLLKSGKSKLILFGFLFIAIVPSCILAWQAMQSAKIQKSFRSFLANEFQFQNTQIVTSHINPEEKLISLSLIGSLVNEEQIASIEATLPKYNLPDYSLNIIQTRVNTGISKKDLENYLENTKEENGELRSALSKELEDTKLLLKIQQENAFASSEFLNELQIVFPKIQYCGFSQLHKNKKEEAEETLILGVTESLTGAEKMQLQQWISSKFGRTIAILEIVLESQE